MHEWMYSGVLRIKRFRSTYGNVADFLFEFGKEVEIHQLSSVPYVLQARSSWCGDDNCWEE